MIILELQPLGQLREYLLRHQDSLRNTQYVTLVLLTLSLTSLARSLSLPPSLLRARALHILPSFWPNRSSRPVMYCAQVAAAMTYLSGRNFVHRDIAARNVLVFSADIVKVRADICLPYQSVSNSKIRILFFFFA